MFSLELHDLARTVLERCRSAGVKIATAESCTGGLIAGLLSEIPGSSDVLDRGFITYSYASKTELLGVPAELIAADGAVAAPVALAMVTGALARSDSAEIAISVTGVAGPGQSERKPAGLVFLAVQRRNRPSRYIEKIFSGDRTEVRLSTVRCALMLILEEVEQA